jgi:hypothetical protein
MTKHSCTISKPEAWLLLLLLLLQCEIFNDVSVAKLHTVEWLGK